MQSKSWTLSLDFEQQVSDMNLVMVHQLKLKVESKLMNPSFWPKPNLPWVFLALDRGYLKIGLGEGSYSHWNFGDSEGKLVTLWEASRFLDRLEIKYLSLLYSSNRASIPNYWRWAPRNDFIVNDWVSEWQKCLLWKEGKREIADEHTSHQLNINALKNHSTLTVLKPSRFGTGLDLKTPT